MRSHPLGAALAGIVLACSACAVGNVGAGVAPDRVRTTLGATDTAWIQLMIPMTAQVVTLLELAAARASGAELRGLVAELSPGYRTELQRMRATLARAGVTPTDEHDGHDLPGMITPADIAVLSEQAGTAFDALAAEHLREEMEQSVRLARSEQTTGSDPLCRGIAATIEKARTVSIDRLNAVVTP